MDDIAIFSLHEKDEGSSQESSASSSEESSVTSFVPPSSIGDQTDTVSLQDSSQDEAVSSSPAHLLDDRDAEVPKEELIIHLDSPSLPPATDAPDADLAEDDHQSHQQSSGSTITSHDGEESSDVDGLVGRYDGRSRFPAVLIEDDDDVCTSVEEDASKEQNSQKVE